MKRILLLALLLLLLAGAGALYMSFMPEKLAVDSLPKVLVPAAHPPAAMRLYAIEAGKMISQAAFAYRGGRFGEQRVFGMGGILVRHPQGDLLFDTGFGRDVVDGDRRAGSARTGIHVPPPLDRLAHSIVLLRAIDCSGMMDLSGKRFPTPVAARRHSWTLTGSWWSAPESSPAATRR